MTKIKNTKKGMAKKTLSMSLVVAMLATSNVPVWAAEFSDGSDADVAVTSEAPVAEDATDDVAAASIVTDGDIKTNLTASAKSVVWGKTVTVSGSISVTNSTFITPNYRWVSENGTVPTGLTGSVRVNTDGTIDNITLDTNDTLVGKTLTLYVYSQDGDPDENYDINTGISVKVEKKALNTFDDPATLTYNGKEQSITTVSNVKDVDGHDVAASDYTVHSSTTGKNAGDKVTVTVTANENSAYVGSVSKTVDIKKSTDDSKLVASTTEGLSYQYTGNLISVPTDKVALKESAEFGGADVSAAIVKAEAATNVGKSEVWVTIDPSKLANFDISKTQYKTTEKIEITKRDLSTAGTIISVTNGKVETGTTVADLANVLNFKGVEGADINKNAIAGEYTLTAKTTSGAAVTTLDKTGTYVITITANETSTKLKGSQTFNITTVGNVLQNVSCSTSYSTDYTGNAITPGKDAFGVLTVDGTAGDEQLQSSQWEITGYADNTDATIYTDITQMTKKKTAKVNIKILSGKYQGETATLSFEIKPLTVTEADITVPETVSYNKAYTEAKEYNLPITVVAKNSAGKVVKTLNASDYTVTYSYKDGSPNYNEDGTPSLNTDGKNEINDKIAYSVKITNTNYVGAQTTSDVYNTKNIDLTADTTKMTTIKAKALSDSMVSVNPSSYVYTGGTIVPSYVVTDGPLVLYKGDEYTEVGITDAVNVGTGKVTVEGKDPFYSGKAVGTFTITAANTSDVKVSIDDAQYTGKQIRPREFKATLNGNDVTNQFEIVSYGENIKAGKGTVVLKPVAGNKNFTGSDITVEFNIINEAIMGDMHIYNAKGIELTTTQTFKFDGNEKTFAKAVVDGLTKAKKSGSGIVADGTTKATADDLEIKYADNVTGNHGTAYVYAVAKAGSGFAGLDTITTADGTVITGVVAKAAFTIDSVKFDEQNVTVKNAAYAGGLPVKPEITIQIGNTTLVEGKDYTVKLIDSSGVNKFVDVTNGKVYGIHIDGINGYEGSVADGDFDYWHGGTYNTACWGIDKKDIKDCTVTVKDGVVTVLNGYLPVPATEYTAKNNNDGTYTVTADSKSKNYTGSKTVKADGKAEEEKPDAPMISSVKVVGNKATVILSGDSEGAAGYDYVISTDRDCITNKDYDSVNKNQVQTSTTFKYVQQGTYYAYCHAWKRDENGMKVFSGWSNAYPFIVSAITPDAPVITNVTVSGSTIKVTYKAAANATGYDVVLGTSSKKENGETRPYNYGAHKVLNLKEGTVTATFKNVPKGTWTVGMHAFNRTSENGRKVFSPWSNLKKATVK